MVKSKPQSLTPKVLFIVGQTAGGKSSLAIELAEKYSGEIICADSLTVYKGLDIGTAKPSTDDRARVRHHLLDVADNETLFTVADFQRQAKEAIADIVSRGKLPIVVGGSGLYVDSILFDYELGPKRNKKQREQLESKTIEQLQQIILDNGYKMPENSMNKRYLVRAVEQKGVNSQNKTMIKGAVVLGMRHEKKIIEGRIRDRFRQMLDEGLMREVSWAFDTYGASSEALKGNIYQVLAPYIGEDVSLDKIEEEVVRQDLRLAKKQLSWWKRNSSIEWFSSSKDAFNFAASKL